VTNRHEYKEALGWLDKDARVCLKYLEKLINEKFNATLKIQRPPPKVNLSKIEANLDSLQKQIDGLRPKVDAAHSLVQEHDEQEKYLKNMTKKAEEILEGLQQHFEELYKSGYYSEGTRRKIRDEGLIRR
jgi:peptidoglycan hydrolase CwlO-like protein